jgi:hypothetical protein
MNLEQISAVAVRVFFFAGFACLVLAIVELASRAFGYTLVLRRNPGDYLDYAVVLLTFVVAILLRQIRDRLART